MSGQYQDTLPVAGACVTKVTHQLYVCTTIMNLRRILGSALLIATIAGTASADGHGRGHDKHDHKHRYDRRYDDDRYDRRRDDRREYRSEEEYREWKRRQARREWERGCPPGLVAHKGECLRPGHVKRDRALRAGDRFDPRQYRRVSNPGLYNLQQQSGYQYYQDNNSIYQVDNKTQKIMNVLSMVQLMQSLGGMAR
jgi:hypothetical protein